MEATARTLPPHRAGGHLGIQETMSRVRKWRKA